MKVIGTDFQGLLVIEPEVFRDERGWFTESYVKSKMTESGIDFDFVQDNHSYSARRGTLRGIHFQINPRAQTKLIRCTRGAIMDTVVDLRKGSDTYLKWFSIELSADNKKQLLIPKGFGHAFLTLTDDVEVQYKVDDFYSSIHDRSVRFDDPELGIEWGIDEPILSPKDRDAPYLKDSDVNFTIRVLVTGASGQLGRDVVRRLGELGIEVIGIDKDDLNLTDDRKVEQFVKAIGPHVVVHCAAYTAVDAAEDDRETCYAVNATATRNLAKVCAGMDAKMVYVSTDYVFDGRGSEPIPEDAPPRPVNFYGYSKWHGEVAVQQTMEKFFIVRTSWLYGEGGDNFVKKIARLAHSYDRINVVDDQIGAPTYTRDLAVFVCDLLQTRKYGIYHGVNAGYCSWYEFALAIVESLWLTTEVVPVTSSQYPTRAERPRNSRLSSKRLVDNGFTPLPHWKDALGRFVSESIRKDGGVSV